VLLIAQELVLKFAAAFGKDIRGFTAEAAQRLVGYSWPGNVRELSNCIERAVALARFEELTVEDLPDKIRAYQPSHVVVASDDPTEVVPLEEVERRYVLRALDALGGNRTLAAQKLGVDRKTLYRKLKAWGAGGDDAD
jgi:two-component system response regulator HydG